MLLERFALFVLAAILFACGHSPSKQVIIIGVDGMDPVFVENHWSQLPNLSQLRDLGQFTRLATTTPPQSPVAWSTFATGLDPAQHGIFDFVHRDPATRAPYLSTERVEAPRFHIGLGAYDLPLSAPRVVSLRRGRTFWERLSRLGVPVDVVHMPTNYPPVEYGTAISGMGTPDLRGTSGTFTFYTDDPDETARNVSGGSIRTVKVVDGGGILKLEGPPNTLRKDHASAFAEIRVDIDPEESLARFRSGESDVILRQGEWSGWIRIEFPLIRHLLSAHGLIRIYARRIHPRLELYVSPVNVDPARPDLPIAWPADRGKVIAEALGEFGTLGIPEDTSAMRQGVFDLGEFLSQSQQVLREERRLFDYSLGHFQDGLLFFYFSSIDQNSHMLWGKHDDQLLEVYREIDTAVGEARQRFPDAALIVMSDHGFNSFDRAVHLNRWLQNHRFSDRAYAIGLNALYLKDKSSASGLRQQLLAWRDPDSGRAVVETLVPVHPSLENQSAAPDFIVGYARGFRASWQTGLGETADAELEDNRDAWIADHCINAVDVPGVLFTNWNVGIMHPALRDLSGVIMGLYGVEDHR